MYFKILIVDQDKILYVKKSNLNLFAKISYKKIMQRSFL